MRRLILIITVLILLCGSAGELSAQADRDRLLSMVRTTLEGYSNQHPNREARAWSLVFLNKLGDLDSRHLMLMPQLLRQMGSKDEMIRQVAISTIRDVIMDIDQKEWVGFLTPMLMDTIKTSQFTDVKSMAVKYLSALSKLGEEQLASVHPLFVQANDPENDEHTRKTAINLLDQMLIEEMDEAWVEGLLRRDMIGIMRTSPYPEAKIVSAKFLELLSLTEGLDEKTLASLPMLFELAQDENAELRELAIKILERIEREAGDVDLF